MEYSDNYYTRTKTYNPYFNKLSESLQCDVCIIGGGLSGLKLPGGARYCSDGIAHQTTTGPGQATEGNLETAIQTNTSSEGSPR